MKGKLLLIVVAIIIFSIPKINFGQAPYLGAASGFALFTVVGAVGNTGISYGIGNIGTNTGAITGFSPGAIVGETYLSDSVSAQAATDVNNAYVYLDGTVCGTPVGATLGKNQVLVPGVYCVGAAATLNGNLILDGRGDPNAVFIFKIDGAFSTSTLSNVILINSASLCNVYWQVNGATSLGANSAFAGTIVVNGAISLLTGSSLMGRALSNVGAIYLDNNKVAIGQQPIATITQSPYTTDSVSITATVTNGIGPFTYLWSPGGQTDSTITVSSMGASYAVATTAMNGCSNTLDTFLVTGIPLPIELMYFNAAPNNRTVETSWATAIQLNNNYFTVERSTDALNFSAIAQIKGAGNSPTENNYIWADENPLNGISYYRLKQTDFNGNSAYSDIVSVSLAIPGGVSVYPNPASTEVFITYSNLSGPVNLNIYDVIGKKVYGNAFNNTTGSQNQTIAIPITGILSSGLYFVSGFNNGIPFNEKLFVK